ncbi:MAG: hypothetical protein WBD40_07815 [Tepidisphaeraceae bacterium]
MHDPGTDPLSPLAKKIIDAGSYRALVITGEKNKLARDLLENVTPNQLLAVPVKDPVAAYAMLGALWLWHDVLNESHAIVQKKPQDLHRSALNLHSKGSKTGLNVLRVQSVENAKSEDQQQLRQEADTLAFWHAIMHRREGDFSNAKYWYARCASHAILPSLGAQASAYLNPMPADKSLLRLTASGWNPSAFVDFVEHLHDHPNDPRHKIAVALQQLEWRVLFDHCTRAAAGQ